MKGAAVALSLVALTSLLLAGCIGDEGLDEQSIDTRPELGPTAAVVHRTGGLSSDPVPVFGLLDQLLPGGVPVPTGVVRLTGESAFEPTLGVTSSGAIFLSSFDRGEAGDYVAVRRSLDDGLTWEDVTPELFDGFSFPHSSNDPYTYVDPWTDRVYISDLQMLACSTLAWSDDEGETWTLNPVGCGHPVGVHDHQTVFSGPPRLLPTLGYENVVYYCINRVVDSACASSLDGGHLFGPLRPLVYPGYDVGQASVSAGDPVGGALEGFCGGLHAHGAVGPDGTVYLPKGHCGEASVAVSRDDGLTWEVVTISDALKSPGHEVAIAIDEAGHAYALWIGEDRLPYLAVSTDAGFTWQEPRMVAPPDVGTTAFPTIAAGAEGRVALAYIGTTATKEYGDMEPEDTWNAYLGVLVDATAEDPVVMTSSLNDPADPIARGVCGGSRCFGTEGGALGDFIDVVIDAEGRPWVALVDACTTDACLGENAEGNDVGVGGVGTLAMGPALRGEVVALRALASVPVATQ